MKSAVEVLTSTFARGGRRAVEIDEDPALEQLRILDQENHLSLLAGLTDEQIIDASREMFDKFLAQHGNKEVVKDLDKDGQMSLLIGEIVRMCEASKTRYLYPEAGYSLALLASAKRAEKRISDIWPYKFPNGYLEKKWK